MSQPPNVLLLLADQHRASALGCYGNPDVATPNLDRMAAEGVRYTNCVSVAPICAPFRSSLQTGLHPHQHGVTRNNLSVTQSAGSIATDAATAGYDTVYIGKCHWHDAQRPGYVPPDARLGWNRWHGYNRGHFYYHPPAFDERGHRLGTTGGLYEPAHQTDLAIDYIDQATGPWMIQLNYGPPHTATLAESYRRPEVRRRMLELNDELGFQLPEEELLARPESWFPQQLVTDVVPRRHYDRYDRARLALQPNIAPELEPLARYYYQEYYAMVSAVDEQVGRMLDAVDPESTLVIYTSDHGDQLASHTRMPTSLQADMPEQGTRVNKGRAKGRPLQNSYRVPLLLWGERAHVGGSVRHGVVSTTDFRPTLQQLFGTQPTPTADGYAFLPDARASANQERVYAGLGLADWRAVYDGHHFYAATSANGDLIDHTLIDLADDPFDQHDLRTDEAASTTRERMRGRLQDWLHQIGDDAFQGEPA